MGEYFRVTGGHCPCHPLNGHLVRMGSWEPNQQASLVLLTRSVPLKKPHEQRTAREAKWISEVGPEQDSRNLEILRLIALAGLFSQLCQSD